MPKLHFLRLSLTAAAVAGVITSGYGAEPADTLSLGGVEVTARSRDRRTALSAATSVQTLDVEKLRQLGVADMGEAVKRFAGAQVRDYGGLGGLKTVSVRNMGAAHTAVSYDGVAVTNTSGGQIDIGRFSLDNVESLSLAVGQEHDLLQSARLISSAALLAVATSHPAFSLGRSTAVEAGLKVASWATVSPWAKVSRRFGAVKASIEGDWLHSDGDYPFTIVNATQTLSERRSNSAITSARGEANIYIDPTQSSTLQLKAHYYWSLRGLPGAVTLYNPVSTEKLLDRSFFVQAHYRAHLCDKWRLMAAAKYASGFNLDHETGAQYDGGVYESRYTQRETYLTVASTFMPFPSLTLALAQDASFSTLHTSMTAVPTPERLMSLTALSARWRVKALTLTASATLTHYADKVKPGEQPDPVTRLTPYVGLSVRPSASLPLYLRAMYKRSFRAPTFTDLYYDRVGTRSLRPEDAGQFNLGVTWDGSLFSAMDYLTLSADCFAGRVSNKIVAIPSTFTWKMMNFGKVDIRGLDLTLATSVTLSPSISLSLSGAYSLQYAVDVTSAETKNYRQQLPYTPRHSGNAGLTVTTRWITAGYSLLAVGKRYYMAQNIPQNEIAGYVEQNLTLSRVFSFSRWSLTLRAEAVNIADARYEVIKFYPMPGRSWRLSMLFKL